MMRPHCGQRAASSRTLLSQRGHFGPLRSGRSAKKAMSATDRNDATVSAIVATRGTSNDRILRSAPLPYRTIVY